jgi:uncharacterized protein DUF1566
MNRYTKLDSSLQELPDDEKDFALLRVNESGLIIPGPHEILRQNVPQREAVQLCAGFQHCGRTDWQLGSVRDLLSLVDYELEGPALDRTFLAHIPFDDWHWTRTDAAGWPDYAWLVYFGGGGSGRLRRYYDGYVLPVCGASRQ